MDNNHKWIIGSNNYEFCESGWPYCYKYWIPHRICNYCFIVHHNFTCGPYPAILIYFWILYSKKYVNKYRRVFSLKKWITGKSNLEIQNIKENLLASYRKEYSLMIGFALSFIAYVLSSIRFIYLKFESMGKGVK